MSQQPHDRRPATGSPAPTGSPRSDDPPPPTDPRATAGPAERTDGERTLDDVPPVAGGTDDSPPAQGEGETDSW